MSIQYNLFLNKTFFTIINILLFTYKVSAQTPIPSIPSNEEIKKVLIERIDKENESVGMVVGIISPEGRQIISYGNIDKDRPIAVDGNTVFEIGSVTKVFTALLLADMVKKNEVSLNDPAAKFLPKYVKMPEKNGKQITLVDLATQTSGLPFWPAGIPANDSGVEMMSKYSEKDLYNFLSGYKLETDIGTNWSYSNLGFGLLGHLLSRCSGKNYEELINTRISALLNMKSTFISLPHGKNMNLSIGHNAQLQQTAYWNVPLLEGCGSIKSTANDLLNLLEAFIGYRHSPLDSAMALMTTIRRPANQFTQLLGWWLTFEIGDNCVITHPGATLGFSSTIAFDPKTRIGVVVLSNSTDGDVGSIAWHILRPGMWPWTTKVAAQKEITLDTRLLDHYAGKYMGAEGTNIFIKHVSAGIVIITPTTPSEGLILCAENDHDFFVKGIDIRVRFQVETNGKVTGLVIHFAGNDYPASRVE